MRSNGRLLTACDRSPHVGDLLALFDIAPSPAGGGNRSARAARVTDCGPDWFAYKAACPVVSIPPLPRHALRAGLPAGNHPIHGDDGLLPPGDGRPTGSAPEEVSCLIYASSWDRWHYVERADGGPVLWEEAAAPLEDRRDTLPGYPDRFPVPAPCGAQRAA